MSSKTVYRKSRKGHLEIRDRSGGLSMMQRRLLILVDGKRTAEEIWHITKVADYEHMLLQLAAAGYIEAAEPSVSSEKLVTRFLSGGPDESLAPKAFMLSTLRSMASPMHAERISKEIDAAQSREELQALVDTWYRAIADNPANLTRVDGIRSTLLAKLI
jgi:hypothetical protein